jgi:CO/xanthine dehydrogenase Mo-binding subunit
MKFALGQAVPRTEDPRLLTGRGRYTDDFVLPRLAHAYVPRSPHAHARISSTGIRASQQMAGVLAVLTGEDWAAEKFGAPGPIIPRQRRDGSPMFVPSRPALVKDRAMLVGDALGLFRSRDRSRPRRHGSRWGSSGSRAGLAAMDAIGASSSLPRLPAKVS